MKNIYKLILGVFALFSVQIASAQCTGTISHSGSGATYTFTSTNPSSSLQNHFWDFGDGTTGSGQTVTHTYITGGNYTVIGHYSDSLNICFDTDSLFLTATVTGGPTCSAAFNITGTSPTFTFNPTGTPTAPPGYYSYTWGFGDGSGMVTANNPSHTYTANGTYNVTCIFYDSIWCADTVIGTVVVTGISTPTCDASFTYVDSNGTFIFNPSTPISGATYSWTLSNGAIYGGQNPVVTITLPGTYVMCLTISDTASGCSDTFCDTIIVTASATCDASFTTSNMDPTYTFTPNTIPSVSSGYFWDFGDGNTSTLLAPTHTYASNGTYYVTFTVIDSIAMCGDSSTTAITITNIIPTPTMGNISGIITYGLIGADAGVIFLIAYDSILGTLTVVDTTYIDSIGLYAFYNVPFGTYLVKAALSPASINYTSFLPTYHAVTPYGGELLWSNASNVVLNTPYLNNININLVAGSNPGGAGFIGGLVSQGANKTGDPISDIQIMILDANGDAVAYGYSDNTGSFNIPDLPYGTYSVYPEVYGRVTTPISVVLSANHIGTNKIRVEVNTSTVETSIATGINNLPQFNEVRLFPNPVKEALNIDLGNELNGSVYIRVMDLTGKVISRTTVSASGIVAINTSELNEGVYILSVENNNDTAIYKFVK
jgi:PKD repeat protein